MAELAEMAGVGVLFRVKFVDGAVEVKVSITCPLALLR